MAELVVVRHAQASFGAQIYDKLSDLGHRQSALVGAVLHERGWVPDRVVIGSLTRHAETLASMGMTAEPQVHAGLNEYDFHDLLATRFAGQVPDLVQSDRRTHFRTLRDTLLDWQAGGLDGAKESWTDFTARVESARRFATREGAEKVLVISSGGPIGRLVAAALEAPDKYMIALNLQVKNTSMTKFIFTKRAFYLHEFNTTPHLDHPDRRALLTYS